MEYLLCNIAKHGGASICACVTHGERLTEEFHLCSKAERNEIKMMP
jgi:hypothetical protein